MKKTVKRILAFLCAAVMTLALTVSAAAANAYNQNDGTDPANPLTDTVSFTFTKHYTLAGDSAGVSPAETFTVAFAPYAVANVPASAGITTANMPAFSNAALSAAAGAADTDDATNVTATVTLPAYSAVGDYWYKVTETAGKTAGVTYDPTEYYLHVQVLYKADDSDDLIRLVSLHKNAPNADGSPNTAGDVKNDGVTNVYSNGSLSVKKTVTGNMGDRTKEFAVRVVFSYPSTDNTVCPVLSTVSYTDGTAKTVAPSAWTYDTSAAAWKATADLSLTHDETVVFRNLPYGVSYTVSETDYSADGYTHTFSFADDDAGSDVVTAEGSGGWTAAGASGTVSDAADELTVNNQKGRAVDVGVILENAPFVALFLLAAAALICGIAAKRRNTEDC